MGNLSETLTELTNEITLYADGKSFINRDLSWMGFNRRILALVIRKSIPLIERMRFLAITASNLDEFCMVRLAKSKNVSLATPDLKEVSGMTYAEEYESLLEEIQRFKGQQSKIFDKMLTRIKGIGYHFTKYKSLSNKEKESADKVFLNEIFPLVTPIRIDGTNDFPPIKSKELTCYVIIKDSLKNVETVALIPIENVNRIFEVKSDAEERKFLFIEDIIKNNLDKIFVNKEVSFFGVFRLLREADMAVDDSADVYLVDRMKDILEKRELSSPIYMEISDKFSDKDIKLITKMFSLKKKNVFVSSNILDYSCLMKLPFSDSDCEYQNFEPQYPGSLIGEHDMLTAIERGDIILHHPYQSYGPVIKFLEHAAQDKNVMSIKQTLYRVSSIDSPIVNSLCKAARSGKQVSVLLELKARFDEEQNISMIDKMKRSGCRIIYGVENFKVHCKFIVVTRKTNKGVKVYSHVGTGNYNDKTAKLYTDISLFTFNQNIGMDLINVFNLISGFSEPVENLKEVSISPYTIRTKLYQLIDKEIEFAQKKKKAKIIIKVNSISDYGIMCKLYQAAESGVKVLIICRGVCSMKPINKNIIIKSIVGRYLEHSRIYYFRNGGKKKIFISSSDLLTRNLDRRVELMVPLYEDGPKEFAEHILLTGIEDSMNSYYMDKDGNYSFAGIGPDSFSIFISEAEEDYRLKNIPKMIAFR
ncbi:MAG: polyphosphate kinase 1 [Herbinix sp.]|nr:polyphosphate kinase 1 [Herbinix sp.]